MEIRNNAEALKSFLGVSAPGSAQSTQVRNPQRGGTPDAMSGDLATLSRAGTEVAQSASFAGERADKVAAIQQAIARGTYAVPASAVAGKVMNTMLESGTDREA